MSGILEDFLLGAPPKKRRASADPAAQRLHNASSAGIREFLSGKPHVQSNEERAAIRESQNKDAPMRYINNTVGMIGEGLKGVFEDNGNSVPERALGIGETILGGLGMLPMNMLQGMAYEGIADAVSYGMTKVTGVPLSAKQKNLYGLAAQAISLLPAMRTAGRGLKGIVGKQIEKRRNLKLLANDELVGTHNELVESIKRSWPFANEAERNALEASYRESFSALGKKLKVPEQQINEIPIFQRMTDEGATVEDIAKAISPLKNEVGVGGVLTNSGRAVGVDATTMLHPAHTEAGSTSFQEYLMNAKALTYASKDEKQRQIYQEIADRLVQQKRFDLHNHPPHPTGKGAVSLSSPSEGDMALRNWRAVVAPNVKHYIAAGEDVVDYTRMDAAEAKRRLDNIFSYLGSGEMKTLARHSQKMHAKPDIVSKGIKLLGVSPLLLPMLQKEND